MTTRPKLILVAILAALLMSAVPASADEPGFNEYQVKAAFLYNFAKFVDWPSDAFAGPQAPFVIAILGGNPFGDMLKTLKGKSVKGHPLVVREAASPDALDDCHLVFFAAGERARHAEWLRQADRPGVLTVGDSDGFIQKGGAINMVVVEGRVAIEVNPDAAHRAKLSVSSKLLSLARIVKTSRKAAP
jgi:hypothetical protein